MVNFMCQPDWVSRCLTKYYFWMSLWGCFWMRLAFELVDWVKQIALFSVNRYHPIHWGLIQNKKGRRQNLPFLPACVSWDIGLLLLSYWELHHWLPWCLTGSLVCRWQITALLRPKCMSQFLIIKHIHICMYTHTHTHTQDVAEVGSQFWVCEIQFVLVLVFIDYCIIFHTNNCKPTFAPPCIFVHIYNLLLALFFWRRLANTPNFYLIWCMTHWMQRIFVCSLVRS